MMARAKVFRSLSVGMRVQALQEIRRRREAREPWKTIAASFGCSLHCVYNWYRYNTDASYRKRWLKNQGLRTARRTTS